MTIEIPHTGSLTGIPMLETMWMVYLLAVLAIVLYLIVLYMKKRRVSKNESNMQKNLLHEKQK